MKIIYRLAILVILFFAIVTTLSFIKHSDSSQVSASSVNNVYYFSGIIFSDGNLNLSSIELLGDSFEFSEDSQSGVYSAVFFSWGNVIGQFYFDVHDDEILENVSIFTFYAIIPEGSDRIEFRKNANVLYSYIIPGDIPSIGPVVVNRLASGAYNASWVDVGSSDVDYSFYYSSDGADWNLIGETQDNNFLFSAPRGNFRVKVVASNGFDTQEAVSGSFVSGNNAPSVFIDSPVSGSVILNGTELVLSGGAYDIDGDSVDLRWESSIDGVLGDGGLVSANLSEGSHLISLYADDGETVSSSSVNISVSSDFRSDVSVEEIYFESEDLSAGFEVFIEAKIHNVMKDNLFNVSFYDGNPNSGGIRIFSSVEFIGANSFRYFDASWDATGGNHNIYVVVSDAYNEEFDVSNNVLSKSLSVARNLCLGDSNSDGVVDLQDFGALKDNFGITGGAVWAMGDFVSDGNVDLQDFGALKDNFGKTFNDGCQIV